MSTWKKLRHRNWLYRVGLHETWHILYKIEYNVK